MRANLIAAVVAALLAGSAWAEPLTGEVSIDGSDVFTASSLTFVGAGNVGGVSGSFAVLPLCDACVSFHTNPLTPGELGELWSINEEGLHSTLTMTSNNFDFNGSETLPGLTVSGTGILTLNGAGEDHDATAGVWELTTQGPTGELVTFSATAVPEGGAPIPEPGSLLLLGTGLFAVGVLGWRRPRPGAPV